MNLAFTFRQGKITVEGTCMNCRDSAAQDLDIPALMVSTVGIVTVLFKKNGVNNRMEIKVPGEYLCEVCSSKLKAVQYADHT